MSILSLTQWLISGLNPSIMFLSCFYFLLVLIQLVLLMNLQGKRKKLQKKFLWEKVKKNLQEKLLKLKCKMEDMLFYKTVSLVSSSCKKLNNLSCHSKILISKSQMMNSVFGLLVNLTMNSLLVSFKKC